MNISQRIAATVLLAFVSLLFVGLYGILNLQQAQDRSESFQTDIIPSLDTLAKLRGLITAERLTLAQTILFQDDQRQAETTKVLAEQDRQYDSLLQQYASTYVNDDAEDAKLVQQDRANLAAYLQARVPLLQKAQGHDVPGALAVLAPNGDFFKVVFKQTADLDAHVDYLKRVSAEVHAENTTSYARTVHIFEAVITAALLALLTMGTRMYISIRAGLKGMQGTMQHVNRELDLTRRVPVRNMDEIGTTATAFNELLARLGMVLRTVDRGSEAVSTATRQISAGNADLSARTEKQAAALEQTAASMTQLSETVRQNADNARQADALTTSATQVVDEGHRVVRGMVATMEDITTSSGKISDITTLIESIAFQTNILALNAAVEAARAGEQGRGFAVVATEVRALAQRAAGAAKEIKALIETSSASVRDGSAQAQEVGRVMDEAQAAIKNVATVVGEIAGASAEQSQGIGQVTQAVGQMDEVTQQNAALVEEAAAAATALLDQAEALRNAVAAFHLPPEDGPALARLVSQDDSASGSALLSRRDLITAS
ncbi:MAG TPA: methyl-accepting chemotaxis protein [Bordetella sp.]|nr:methyl-accepting chemotaxis protein [Bordetella sp.]